MYTIKKQLKLKKYRYSLKRLVKTKSPIKNYGASIINYLTYSGF